MSTKFQGLYQAAGETNFDFAPGLYDTPEAAIEAAMKFAWGTQYSYGVRQLQIEEKDNG